jgi:predicted nucleic acid-binding protein
VRVSVDTNVFVSSSTLGSRSSRGAREVVSGLARSRALVLSSQAPSELCVALTRKLAEPLDPRQALRAITDLATFPVVAIDATLVQRAASRSIDEAISHWDALILEAALETGAETVYAEDLQAGATHRGVTVVDPF